LVPTVTKGQLSEEEQKQFFALHADAAEIHHIHKTGISIFL
jgi:hypothetical protein